MDIQEQKYKKIVIQQLQNRPQLQAKPVTNSQLIGAMNRKFTWSQKPVACYKDSGIGVERIINRNGVFRTSAFFDAFLNAYTQHGDIVLVPDEIWIMITFYISTYIDKNAEKLRPKLVSHEGVKNLTVIEKVQNQEDSLVEQQNWDHFFDQIIKSIEKQTKNGIVEAFSCDFTTTNKTYRVISTAIVMNSLQKFFNYHRRFCVCGINNVYMAGQLEDWSKMTQKLEKFVQFDVDGELKTYIQHMKVILYNFVQTFQQKPNVEWWNTVMQSYEKKQVYGGQKTEVDGWILHFFGMYKASQIHGFPEMTIKVPIKLINQATNMEKDLHLVADWVSVSKLNERSYKPDVAVCIFEMEQRQISAVQEQQNTEKVEKQ